MVSLQPPFNPTPHASHSTLPRFASSFLKVSWGPAPGAFQAPTTGLPVDPSPFHYPTFEGVIGPRVRPAISPLLAPASPLWQNQPNVGDRARHTEP